MKSVFSLSLWIFHSFQPPQFRRHSAMRFNGGSEVLNRLRAHVNIEGFIIAFIFHHDDFSTSIGFRYRRSPARLHSSSACHVFSRAPQAFCRKFIFLRHLSNICVSLLVEWWARAESIEGKYLLRIFCIKISFSAPKLLHTVRDKSTTSMVDWQWTFFFLPPLLTFCYRTDLKYLHIFPLLRTLFSLCPSFCTLAIPSSSISSYLYADPLNCEYAHFQW